MNCEDIKSDLADLELAAGNMDDQPMISLPKATGSEAQASFQFACMASINKQHICGTKEKRNRSLFVSTVAVFHGIFIHSNSREYS